MCPDCSVILQSCKICLVSFFFSVFLMSEYSVFVEHRDFKVSIGSVSLVLILRVYWFSDCLLSVRGRRAKISSYTCGFVCFLQLCPFGFIYS